MPAAKAESDSIMRKQKEILVDIAAVSCKINFNSKILLSERISYEAVYQCTGDITYRRGLYQLLRADFEEIREVLSRWCTAESR